MTTTNTIRQIEDTSFARAMALATMDLQSIKPQPKAPSNRYSHPKYNPKPKEVYGSWIVSSEAYSKNFTRASDGHIYKKRLIDCDCACGRTIGKAVEVHRLCNGVTRKCQICILEDKQGISRGSKS